MDSPPCWRSGRLSREHRTHHCCPNKEHTSTSTPSRRRWPRPWAPSPRRKLPDSDAGRPRSRRHSPPRSEGPPSRPALSEGVLCYLRSPTTIASSPAPPCRHYRRPLPVGRRLRPSFRGLPLDGAGEGGDVVLDEEGVDEGDGDRAEQGAGHEGPPVENVTAHQLGEDPDGDRLLLGRREEDKGVEELVPGQGEGEDPRREDPGNGEREGDADHGLNPARPVDPRAVFDLSWNGLEVPHQEPGAERDQEGRVGEDHGPGRVADPEGLDHVAKRDEE